MTSPAPAANASDPIIHHREPMSPAEASVLAIHPLAEKLPPLTDEEMDTLTQDIGRQGILEPVYIWRNMLIDGRHRCLAAMATGRQVPIREVVGDEQEVVRLVLSLNVNRRALDQHGPGSPSP